MILTYLVEKFLTADKFRTEYYDGYAEIFVNPNSSEMKDIAIADENDENSVRLAVDKSGNVYAWIYTILHDEMEDILNKEWVLRFEYNYPDNVIWLGGKDVNWKKYGTNDVVKQLIRAVPKLTTIQYSNKDGNAWEK